MAIAKKKRIPNLEIGDAKLWFRNFEGRQTDYNRAGDRNFNIQIMDEKLANQLAEDGWNIKAREPREGHEDDGVRYMLQVAVRYDNFPPMIYLVGKTHKTLMDEDTVKELDSAEIVCADLIISGSGWEVNGKTGIKAYLKEAYFTIEQNQFAEKYSDM